jgi:hypothetical protein
MSPHLLSEPNVTRLNNVDPAIKLLTDFTMKYGDTGYILDVNKNRVCNVKFIDTSSSSFNPMERLSKDFKIKDLEEQWWYCRCWAEPILLDILAKRGKFTVPLGLWEIYSGAQHPVVEFV